MTRLPKKRGITQDGEDKSLILRQYSFKLTWNQCPIYFFTGPDIRQLPFKLTWNQCPIYFFTGPDIRQLPY
jgi:hypothetical protein